MFVLFVEELAISELRKHVCIPIVSTRYLCFIHVHWLGWLRFRPPIIFFTRYFMSSLRRSVFRLQLFVSEHKKY